MGHTRKLLMALLASVLALGVLLGGLEAGLHLAGYGAPAGLARRAPVPGGGWAWRENRRYTEPWFSPALARRPVPFRLASDKAPGTIRVFILGSSAAMGDPDASFSMARMLQVLLAAAHPGRRFEVVNAAITAVNSSLVRGMAADCLRLQPDLLIVYEGNNEVIGPFGPSGVMGPFMGSQAAVRTMVWAEATRTGQLVRAAARAAAGTAGAPADWGGMGMFLGRACALDDPRLAGVSLRFRENLEAIAGDARGAACPLLLCTVLANTRDFAPFLSLHRPGLAADARAAWDAHVAAAGDAGRAGDLAGEEGLLRAALSIDDRHAELVFRLGRVVLQRGRAAEAAALLQRALDLDALRFRTDSALNTVIRQVAALTGTPLVDLARQVGALGADGIPGDDLLYEHVHLNFRGTYEAALALQPAVEAAVGLPSGGAPPPDMATMRRRLGYSAYEQGMIAAGLLGRFRRPPFTGQADNGLRVGTWEHRLAAANALLEQPGAREALVRAGMAAVAGAPEDWMLARNTGQMLVSLGRPAEAIPLLEHARAWIDDDVDTLVALGYARRGAGRGVEAAAAFAAARAIEPRYPTLPPP